MVDSMSEKPGGKVGWMRSESRVIIGLFPIGLFLQKCVVHYGTLYLIKPLRVRGEAAHKYKSQLK